MNSCSKYQRNTIGGDVARKKIPHWNWNALSFQSAPWMIKYSIKSFSILKLFFKSNMNCMKAIVLVVYTIAILLSCSIQDSFQQEGQGQGQDDMDANHASDPKDPLQLATRTLEKAFSRYQNGDIVSVFKLLGTINKAAGEPRLLLLRIFELMDKNMDGKITNDEFTSLYMAPTAYPDKAVELMFRLYDLDKNGYITQWEYMRLALAVDGINQNVQDKWIEAGQKVAQQDVNGDNLVDLTEFSLYVVWQVNVGIYNQRKKEQMKTKKQ